MSEETREGPTPNGGVKSTAYYQDDTGQPAEKGIATRAVIVEYDKDGNSINRTYGTLGKGSSVVAIGKPANSLPK